MLNSKMWTSTNLQMRWIIDELKGIGCDTARSVLALNKEELVRRTDLEEETVDEILRIFTAEFDES